MFPCFLMPDYLLKAFSYWSYPFQRAFCEYNSVNFQKGLGLHEKENFKMNNEVKAKKHILCEKAPFLAMILGCLIASVVIGVPTVLAGNSFVGQIVSCIVTVVFLIGFNRWFAPEFKGVFKAGISAGEILIISLPFIFKLVFSYAACSIWLYVLCDRSYSGERHYDFRNSYDRLNSYCCCFHHRRYLESVFDPPCYEGQNTDSMGWEVGNRVNGNRHEDLGGI